MKSLYLHIPFCKQKCFYCSFVVCVSHQKRKNFYIDCLVDEMKQFEGEQINSIYFGGGTPSVLDLQQLSRIFHAIHLNFRVLKNAEITIEMNPEDVTNDKVTHLIKLGVNRFSLGVQSLDDVLLKNMGRGHNSAMAKMAYDILRQNGAHNISIDLISMLPGQDLKHFQADCQKVLDWYPEHVSFYALTIEKNSRLFVEKKSLPTDQQQKDFFVSAKNSCEHAGLSHYEVSNFARKGFESFHNKNYWLGGDYLGLGLAAHSHIKGRRFWNVSRLMDYLKRIQQNGQALEGQENLSLQQQFIESILFGLRMTVGIDLDCLQKRYGVMLDTERVELITALCRQKYLVRNQNIIKMTMKGVLVLDEISARLV